MKKIILALAFAFIGLGFISVPRASAAPAPYTGGAAVARVLYPADGSTITITSTGAVIKQSPGHSAYREGWIDPNNICSIHVASDLQGQLQPGSSNPYTVNGQSPSRVSCSSATSSNTPAPSVNRSSTSNATANANATANVVTASQPATATQSSATTTAATPTSSTSQSQSSTNGKGGTLPNTGPADVLPAFGISTVLGTIGHAVFTRRRLK